MPAFQSQSVGSDNSPLEQKVWAVLASYPRNFSLTIPNLLRHSIAPIHNAGRLAGITIATGGVDHLDLAPIRRLLWAELGKDVPTEVMSLSKGTLVGRTSSLVAKAKEKGNPFLPKNGDSLERSIQFLSLLSFAHDSISSNPMATVFIRADLYQDRDVALLAKRDRFPEDILLPNWHQWYGRNDRIAILPNRYTSPYFQRVKGLDRYLSKTGMFHPEAYLKHCLDGYPVREELTEKYFRTREGNRILAENFKARPTVAGRFRYLNLMLLSRQLPT